MNSKIKKGLRLAAAAIFVFALALNIKLTLDDPFLFVSDIAIASSTGGSGQGGCDPQIETSVTRFTYNNTWYACGEPQSSGIYFETRVTKDCWTGGTDFNCEGGHSFSISNITGTTVCSFENYVLIICI